MREQVVSFPPQPVITEDNLVVSIDTVVYFQVTDARAATYEIANYLGAVEQLTTTTLRNVVGGLNLEEALTSRDNINGQLRVVLDEATGKWGIRVGRVELKAIEPPVSIQDAMEQQLRAERTVVPRSCRPRAPSSPRSSRPRGSGRPRSSRPRVTQRPRSSAPRVKPGHRDRLRRHPRRRPGREAPVVPVPADAPEDRRGHREQALDDPERVHRGALRHREGLLGRPDPAADPSPAPGAATSSRGSRSSRTRAWRTPRRPMPQQHRPPRADAPAADIVPESVLDQRLAESNRSVDAKLAAADDATAQQLDATSSEAGAADPDTMSKPDDASGHRFTTAPVAATGPHDNDDARPGEPGRASWCASVRQAAGQAPRRARRNCRRSSSSSSSSSRERRSSSMSQWVRGAFTSSAATSTGIPSSPSSRPSRPERGSDQRLGDVRVGGEDDVEGLPRLRLVDRALAIRELDALFALETLTPEPHAAETPISHVCAPLARLPSPNTVPRASIPDRRIHSAFPVRPPALRRGVGSGAGSTTHGAQASSTRSPPRESSSVIDPDATVAGVVDVPSGTSVIIEVAVYSGTRSIVRPVGSMTCDAPTVEMFTSDRPVSIARIRAISSCCRFSSVPEKSALFVCARITCAPPRAMSRVRPSSTMSKQIAMPALDPRATDRTFGFVPGV